MGALKGNLADLGKLRRTLQAAPVTVAAEVARKASPELTGLTQSAFDSNQSVYGDSRPKSKVDGKPLTLRKTGSTESELRFVTVGRVVRCVLSRPYTKYLIGKYDILPNGPMPQLWRERLQALLRTVRVF